MASGKIIVSNAQDSNLTCGFLLRSEVNPGNKNLKIGLFVNNEGYHEGEHVIYSTVDVRYVNVSEHHKAKVPFIADIRRPQNENEWNDEVEKSVAALVLQDHASKKAIDEVLSWKKTKKEHSVHII